jgi:hypothetical protein
MYWGGGRAPGLAGGTYIRQLPTNIWSPGGDPRLMCGPLYSAIYFLFYYSVLAASPDREHPKQTNYTAISHTYHQIHIIVQKPQAQMPDPDP